MTNAPEPHRLVASLTQDDFDREGPIIRSDIDGVCVELGFDDQFRALRPLDEHRIRHAMMVHESCSKNVSENARASRCNYGGGCAGERCFKNGRFWNGCRLKVDSVNRGRRRRWRRCGYRLRSLCAAQLLQLCTCIGDACASPTPPTKKLDRLAPVRRSYLAR